MLDFLRSNQEDDKSEETEESSLDTTERCSSPPSDHRHMDHDFDPERKHYGYFTRKKTWSKNEMYVYEKYWHECRVCGNTCDHHERDIGSFKITDDGLVITSGAADGG